jgi:hypothetical protein
MVSVFPLILANTRAVTPFYRGWRTCAVVHGENKEVEAINTWFLRNRKSMLTASVALMDTPASSDRPTSAVSPSFAADKS